LLCYSARNRIIALTNTEIEKLPVDARQTTS
jgi:hypothetical protein